MSRPVQNGTILAACILVGAVTFAATFLRGGRQHGESAVASEDYGRRLFQQTTEYLGPDVADPRMRYTGSRLACAACHLGAGGDSGVLSLVTSTTRYPRNASRIGGTETIEMRVNGCMMRSLNGRPLPENSAEMRAMVAYMRFLASRDAATGAAERAKYAAPDFPLLPRAANLEAGRHVFETRCATCHGADGAGVAASADPKQGFVFPPLWGPNSFNDGAGLHRLLTAAAFIKAKMPLGSADLDDGQAYDVAGYINSQPRPEMGGLDRDYPNRAKKPIDNPYGPYADPFPMDQHRMGPFPPIAAFYSKKSK